MEEEIIEENISETSVGASEEIYQIFDKVFKKILTLSSRAVINLINGLFGTEYPLDNCESLAKRTKKKVELPMVRLSLQT